MPRAGPVYTLPEAPFIPNTPIVSASVNSDLSDIAAALTASLARDGSGGMTAALPLVSDGWNFLTDPDTGMHRTAANTIAVKAGGADILTMNASSATVLGALNVTGKIFQNFNPVLMVGEVRMWTGTTPPNSEWLICNGQTVSRTAPSGFPQLWTFAAAEIASGSLLYTNGDGTTTFTVPDFSGRVPAMRDGTVSRLTVATMTPNGLTYGAVGGLQQVSLVTPNLPALPAAMNDGNPNGGASTGISRGTTTGTGVLPITGNIAAPILNVQPTIIVNYIIYGGAPT